MSSEHASDVDPEAVEEDSAAVLFSVFGFDVVLEEAFVSFPWRAGLKRGPVALAVTFVLVFAVAAASGVSGGTIAGTVVYLALIVYGLHGIPVVGGQVPGFLEGVAGPLLDIPVLRGLTLTGPNHGDPVGHLLATLGGRTEAVGHINALPADPSVPIAVYAAIPAVVLVGVGAEFALRYWREVTVDSVAEVARFGAAVAAGYVLVLFVGSFFVTMVGLRGVVLPDRYLTVILGFAYPAVFATVGGLLVYVQQELLSDDDTEGDADAETGGEPEAAP
jgi:hypothetical protein